MRSSWTVLKYCTRQASSTTSSSTKHKLEKGSEIVDEILEMYKSQVELARKMLEIIQQQETRKAKEEQPKERRGRVLGEGGKRRKRKSIRN